MARPKSKSKKHKPITVHCTSAEYIIVKSKSAQCRLSMSQYLLDLALDRKITNKLNDQQARALYQLAGMANNLNQVAKHLNQNKPFTQACYDSVESIRSVLKELTK